MRVCLWYVCVCRVAMWSMVGAGEKRVRLWYMCRVQGRRTVLESASVIAATLETCASHVTRDTTLTRTQSQQILSAKVSYLI